MGDSTPLAPAPKIWWSNTFFFVGIHVAAVLGVSRYPAWGPSAVPRATLALAFLIWQLADYGITVGYHRLYSHRAFRASLSVRITLAALGSAGFQGSIKWWCLRHRLHHRFTDDPVHDPYAATKGLFYSHMGWIFYKPTYERMELVDRKDLDSDPVVRFQHKHYVPLALFFGFIVPTLLGSIWGDPKGAFVWGGLVSRLFIWHCTFLVNSLAHWDGLQPYSDENTSRGNLVLALLTGGEGSHNFHAFPHDYRSGPSLSSWDPSKWIIVALERLGLASGLRRAREEDMKEALTHMSGKSHHHNTVENDVFANTITLASKEDEAAWEGESWDLSQAARYIADKPGRCVILVEGFFCEVTMYMAEHPGGTSLLRTYSIRNDIGTEAKSKWRDASWAYAGGLNNHSRAARRRMRELRVARLQT